jgi:hypothetical protein
LLLHTATRQIARQSPCTSTWNMDVVTIDGKQEESSLATLLTGELIDIAYCVVLATEVMVMYMISTNAMGCMSSGMAGRKRGAIWPTCFTKSTRLAFRFPADYQSKLTSCPNYWMTDGCGFQK